MTKRLLPALLLLLIALLASHNGVNAFAVQPSLSCTTSTSRLPAPLARLSASSTDTTSTSPFDAYQVGSTSTVETKDLIMGTGDQVKQDDIVQVYYKGTVMNTGNSFGEGVFKFKFGERNVMPGWNSAVDGMRLGGSRVARIPPSFGYGARGQKTIPPNADLELDVELQDISSGPIAEFAMEFGLGNNRKTYALAAITLFLAVSPMLPI